MPGQPSPSQATDPSASGARARRSSAGSRRSSDPVGSPEALGPALPLPPAASVALVLPAYNESARLGPALDELFGYLRRRETETAFVGRDGGAGPGYLPRRVEVIVVDDGSTDGTGDLVRARPEAGDGHLPDVTLRLLAVPHGGKGAAVRAGMLAAESELIVFMDADLATPPDQVPLLVDALATHDVALGSRIQRDGKDMRKSQPVYRRLIGKAFHVLASWWVVGSVRDTQCGFKGFTREAAHDLFGRQRVLSIVFDVELIYLARKRGYRIVEVPVLWEDRRGSRMKARLGLAVRVAWDLFRIPLIHRSVARAARPASDARA